MARARVAFFLAALLFVAMAVALRRQRQRSAFAVPASWLLLSAPVLYHFLALWLIGRAQGQFLVYLLLATVAGLSASYHAPEQEKLFTSMTPAKTAAESFGTDMGTSATALDTFAESVRTIKAEVAKIKAEAHTFLGTIHDGKITVHSSGGYNPYAGGNYPSSDHDEDWDSNQGAVDTNNKLIDCFIRSGFMTRGRTRALSIIQYLIR